MNQKGASIVEEQWLEFGKRIRTRRENLRLTQEEAAARISMTRQQWHRIEKGASTKRTTVERLAKALDCDPVIVLHWAGFQDEALKEAAIRKSPSPAGSQLVTASGFSVDELLLHYFHSLPVDVQSGALAYLGSLYLKHQTPEAAKALEEKMFRHLGLRPGEKLEVLAEVPEG